MRQLHFGVYQNLAVCGCLGVRCKGVTDMNICDDTTLLRSVLVRLQNVTSLQQVCDTSKQMCVCFDIFTALGDAHV